MPKPAPKQAIEALAAMKKWPRRGGRSPLYDWMRESHDTLAAGFVIQRPDWQGLATYLNDELALTGARGGRITHQSARKTWLRVRKDLARIQKITEAVTSPAAVSSPPQTSDPGAALPSIQRPAFKPDRPRMSLQPSVRLPPQTASED